MPAVIRKQIEELTDEELKEVLKRLLRAYSLQDDR